MALHVKHLSGDKRRAITVETVIELAAEQNPNDITTAAIANRMGLSQGALFKHFPNKDAILSAVMEWVSKRLLSRVDKAVQSIASPTAALEAMFMAHVSFVAEHPGVPRMLFGELQHASDTAPKRMAQTLISHYRERIHKFIEAGKAEGELYSGLDNDAAVSLFVGSIQGLVMQSLLAGDVKKLAQEAPRVFNIYLRGIRSA
ncbi:TetR/AcrR family transcriptional regulator [Sedimenticola selenatireducens]|uniref:TetR/AcrR family transcriptional regulator n=1 Tax=Sedimenticola selenatireducens TaxID=191960 RepID=A0A558DNZ2_9GAMM|nr:TetR/AcrR family transcriptional regulator [Sedimenticola selenatireducens]TVO78406.1 TetR/AcrR family transcriptional regulator [Sedimenticola selenatireducens]TVT62736.1 MAG: TetR/AcrR family transcriptional regulator [Sedimenticola selenatireducens]